MNKLGKLFQYSLVALLAMSSSCTNPNKFEEGTYGFDAQFLKDNDVSIVELSSQDGKSKVMIIPQWQGRVMTSTASGVNGNSYGWINHSYIKNKEYSSHFNPFGGEERFWLGPEGGPFSLYFKPNTEQVYENWIVPPVLDTEAFDVKSSGGKSVSLEKDASLINTFGTEFKVKIQRDVTILDQKEIEKDFGIKLTGNINFVGYKSINKITNVGTNEWEKNSGLISIWLLGCFSATPTTTVFIPYNKDAEGPIVNDSYFGKVPSDRLVADDGICYFKIDGKLRSKIGVSPSRATNLCGSYDSEKKVLTILWYSLPQHKSSYVNSQWGEQDDPYSGDALNSYNDGPLDDGSIMGPFYELESSSPGAELMPNSSLLHEQKIIHIEGDEAELGVIVQKIFGVDLDSVKNKF